MPRTVLHRYLSADIKRLTHNINHLTSVLHTIVSKGFRDQGLLDELNKNKLKLLNTKNLLKEQNVATKPHPTTQPMYYI